MTELKVLQPDIAVKAGPPSGTATLAPAPVINTSSVPTPAPLEAKSAQELWDKEEKSWREKPWMDSTRGRLAIRVFSRGIMGAAFFAMGTHLANRAMDGYTDKKAFNDSSFAKTGNDSLIDEGIRLIAKCWDKTAGVAIKSVGGEKMVTFRDTRQFAGYEGKGRSLGHEIVDVTFNFACASVGDAWGRNLAALIDPNVKTKWIKDGGVDFPGMVKGMVQSVWTMLSYNQAEDWAVALPYVYMMKAQRNVLDKWKPGFRYDFDLGAAGSSFQVNEQGQITGNYNAVGMLDLQTRFMTYNIGTLMYRETYDAVSDKLAHWKQDGYKAPEIHLPKDPVEAVKKVGEKAGFMGWYVAKSIIKAGLPMLFTVPFFSIFRTPQNKYCGAAIHPEHGPIEMDRDLLANQKGDNTLRANFKTFVKPEHKGQETPFTGKLHFRNGGQDLTPSNPFNQQTSNAGYNHAFRAYNTNDGALFGRVMDGLAVQQLNFSDRIVRGTKDVLNAMNVNITNKDIDTHMRRYTNAAMAYTPYFMAKTEFAHLWSTDSMDRAINRTIDGAVHFKPGEFVGGLRCMVKSFLHIDEEREVGLESVFSQRSYGTGDVKPLPWAKEALTRHRDIPGCDHINKKNAIDKAIENRSAKAESSWLKKARDSKTELEPVVPGL